MGTAAPESIYEARFVGKIQAARPNAQAGDCEICLPLPPQIISLADLSIKVDNQPGDKVVIRNGKLVWHGPLPAEPASLMASSSAGAPPSRRLRCESTCDALHGPSPGGSRGISDRIFEWTPAVSGAI